MKVSEMTDYKLLEVLTGKLKPEQTFMWMERDTIHRAEMTLDEGLWGEYVMALAEVVDIGLDRDDEGEFIAFDHFFSMLTATPRQRAEALVRTLGGGE